MLAHQNHLRACCKAPAVAKTNNLIPLGGGVQACVICKAPQVTPMCRAWLSSIDPELSMERSIFFNALEISRSI